ncbi:MAG: zinc ribbon domain-containing protein [Cyanosarcina radialis HA8281-LM2]|jgi:putative FmdB family regulatory protein|nr:zinc ribbon domain-containing protein [Cyanosarcina radialis HA8281-LM2]
MPLYEYKCENCGEFEAWRSIAEIDIPMVCPDCQLTARRIFSPPHVISLNSGDLALGSRASKEPKLVQRNREPDAPRYQSSRSGRPWAIEH